MIEYKNFKNECGIYCFTNKINGKCYIGQAVNLKKRLRSHYSTFKKQNIPNMIFYTAVAKYGQENFDLEILEYCDNTLNLESLKALLDEREKFYIKEKNSYVPNGYNQTLGGDAGVLGYKMTEEQKEKISSGAKKSNERFKKLICLRNIKEPKYYIGFTYEEAAKKSGVSRNIIQSICNDNYKHPYAKGWTFANNEIKLFNNVTIALKDIANNNYVENSGKFEKGNVFYQNIPIYEYNSKNILIKTYPTLKSVAEELNISPSTLTKYLHKDDGIQIVHGRRFKLSKHKKVKLLSDEHKQKIKNNCRNKKKVDQFDLNNKFLKTFDSISDAAKAVNADMRTLRRTCNGQYKTCKGYIWKFHIL